jgi:SAM-dependent methyltransferase
MIQLTRLLRNIINMIKKEIKSILGCLGYEIHKVIVLPDTAFPHKKRASQLSNPPSLEPFWPLPRGGVGFSDDEICKKFAEYNWWHYAYAFEGGLSFPIRHNRPDKLINDPDRHLQRFRHFMPYIINSYNGSLKGKKVLDIACNSGFWSIQCALLGADVVGFDARPELIAQAELIKSIVGVQNVSFKVLDFWNMDSQLFGGTFDLVLNLGFLFHLSDPLEALKRTKAMTHKNILLDTGVYCSNNPVVQLRWEEPSDIWTACNQGIVAFPTKSSMDIMLRYIDIAEWFEIPIRSKALPRDYLEHRRVSWLLTV